MLCQVTKLRDLLTFNAIDSHWPLSAFDKFDCAPGSSAGQPLMLKGGVVPSEVVKPRGPEPRPNTGLVRGGWSRPVDGRIVGTGWLHGITYSFRLTRGMRDASFGGDRLDHERACP